MPTDSLFADSNEFVLPTDDNAELPRLKLCSIRNNSYTIVHPNNFIFDPLESSLEEFICKRPVLVVIDRVIEQTYGNAIEQYFGEHNIVLVGKVVLDGHERYKNWANVELICKEAIRTDFPRQGLIIGIGGGVVLDIVGFAASIFRRGIGYLRIPTTLVGLVDVAVGIKHAINFEGKKNILGAFYPPLGSVNDFRFLVTLPKREISCGLAEIIKMALVKDSKLFEVLEIYGQELWDSNFQNPCDIARRVIIRAEIMMMEELSPNLFETSYERLVDFGHTFSPSVESLSQYIIPHGEAVALDMALSTAIAVIRNLCSNSALLRLIQLYKMVDLPAIQQIADANDLYKAIPEAKAHRGGKLNLVVPVEIGKATFIQDVSVGEIDCALNHLATLDSLGKAG